MPSFLEIGYLSGHALIMLEQVISEIYLPMLSNMQFEKKDTTNSNDKSAGKVLKYESLKSDLVVSVQKFANQISQFSQQVEGEHRLKIPEEFASLKEADVEEVSKKAQITKELEKLAEEWIEAVSTALSTESKKVPLGNGPMAEIEFWRDRYASLFTLYEQLNLPIVNVIVSILSKAQIPCSTSLEFQLAELNKAFTESKDNVKFLSTLERHFKNIVTSSLASVNVILLYNCDLF